MINTVRRLRFELSMTQNELAKALGISQQFISTIEAGKAKLPADRAKQLRKLLAKRRFLI